MAGGGRFLIASFLNFGIGRADKDQSTGLILKPEPHFNIDGMNYRLRINRSANAKRMKLQVKATRDVVLVLPKRMPLKAGYIFVRDEYPWICEQVGNLEDPVSFHPGNSIPIFGTPHEIVHVPKIRGYVWREEQQILVAGGLEHVPRRVKDWASREIKKEIGEKAINYGQMLGVPIRKITIRDQKSRWGSCSSAGNLNFSWRLIMMPARVVDYIVAHEVTHLVHMNHSAEFWDLLRTICPEMQDSKRWLKENGTSLHKYGATM